MSIVPIKNWRDYPISKEKYQLYLASRDWAVLRELVKARSHGICERCQTADGQQVHHQTYERIYQERLEDLVHLCGPCHEFLSAKRGRDPLLSVPPCLMGYPIRGVYLAGKITGTKWRDQIVANGWSSENDSAIDFELGYEWSTVRQCLPIPDGRRLDLNGPFWRATDMGGHANASYTEGPHAFTTVNYYTDEKTGQSTSEREAPDLAHLTATIQSAIRRSDLFFAWIDSTDCFGTLAEIGYASAKDCRIAIASPPDFDQAELWLARQFAHFSGRHKTPGDAWRALWSTPLSLFSPEPTPVSF